MKEHLWFQQFEGALQAQHARAAVDGDVVEGPLGLRRQEAGGRVVPATHRPRWSGIKASCTEVQIRCLLDLCLISPVWTLQIMLTLQSECH